MAFCLAIPVFERAFDRILLSLVCRRTLTRTSGSVQTILPSLQKSDGACRWTQYSILVNEQLHTRQNATLAYRIMCLAGVTGAHPRKQGICSPESPS